MWIKALPNFQSTYYRAYCVQIWNFKHGYNKSQMAENFKVLSVWKKNCLTGSGKTAFNHYSWSPCSTTQVFYQGTECGFCCDKHISLTCRLSFSASSLGFSNRKWKLRSSNWQFPEPLSGLCSIHNSKPEGAGGAASQRALSALSSSSSSSRTE